MSVKYCNFLAKFMVVDLNPAENYLIYLHVAVHINHDVIQGINVQPSTDLAYFFLDFLTASTPTDADIVPIFVNLVFVKSKWTPVDLAQYSATPTLLMYRLKYLLLPSLYTVSFNNCFTLP